MSIEKFMHKYQKYLSFFRMRFIAGLQYRAAALAGIATQFMWGALQLLMFRAFYEVNPDAFPMSREALASYIWLQQALLALFMAWFYENEIFQSIIDGGVSYELCRPANIYDLWFVRSMANRISKAVLRCLPILAVAGFLPKPYNMGLPVSVFAGLWFVITGILAFLNVVAFCMLVYISTFYTYSSTGVRMISVSVVEFFAGAVVPLPFLPESVRRVVELLPFASMQNVPLRIYSGDISGIDVYQKAGIQVFWIVVLVLIGKKITASALKRIVVQGG